MVQGLRFRGLWAWGLGLIVQVFGSRALGVGAWGLGFPR